MFKVASYGSIQKNGSLWNSMIADRTSQFVDRLKWTVPGSKTQRETDEYDCFGTVYCVVHLKNVHLASVRVRWTSGHSMTKEVFGELSSNIPKLSVMYPELSRLCASRKIAQSRRKDALISLKNGLRCYFERMGVSSAFAVTSPEIVRLARLMKVDVTEFGSNVSCSDTNLIIQWRP